MPPRHGKSLLTSQYFPAWFLATYPHRRVILASYEATFAEQWGRRARDVLERQGPALGIQIRQDSSAASRWDLAGCDGGMVTTGIGGPLTGKGADLLLIDDPVKNAEEACSPTFRNRNWEWFTSTAYTRLEPGGSVILIQTRWHDDDLAGRILKEAESGGELWEVLNLPALAETGDALGRQPGEPLWPERYDRAKLNEIARTVGGRWWSALYQQRPVPEGGGLFRREWFKVVEAAPTGLRKVRSWDLAATEKKAGNDPDWTAGALLGRSKEGNYYLLDMRRVRATPASVQALIRQTAELDGKNTMILMEKEPGSAGVTVIDTYARLLAGYNFHGEAATGDKALRADPFSAQCEAGNVYMVKGDWCKDFLDEAVLFPFGSHDDQIDAVSAGFSKLATGWRNVEIYV